MAEKGAWVRIKKVVFEGGQRSDRLPEETRKVPFVVWVKGELESAGEVGDTVRARTKSGRVEEGELVEVNPVYELGYGGHVEQLRRVGDGAREALFGAGGGR